MYRIQNKSLGNGVPFLGTRGRFSSSGNGVRNPVPDLSLIFNPYYLSKIDNGYHIWILRIKPPT